MSDVDSKKGSKILTCNDLKMVRGSNDLKLVRGLTRRDFVSSSDPACTRKAAQRIHRPNQRRLHRRST